MKNYITFLILIFISQLNAQNFNIPNNWDEFSIESHDSKSTQNTSGPDGIVIKVINNKDTVYSFGFVFWYDDLHKIYTAYTSIYRTFICIDSSLTITELSGELEKYCNVGDKVKIAYFQKSTDKRFMRKYERLSWVMFRTKTDDYYFGRLMENHTNSWEILFVRLDKKGEYYYARIDKKNKTVDSNYPPLVNTHVANMEVFTQVGELNQLPY